MAPLKLEEATDGTFLETSFRVDGDYVHFRLKNVNQRGVRKVWRYQAYDSYTPYTQKRSTLIATLKKVDFMAGSKNELYESAMDKLAEFASLGYPEKVRQYACHRVGRETRHQLWFAVARDQWEL